jgi:dTDP-glucose 4,6-dehydratase
MNSAADQPVEPHEGGTVGSTVSFTRSATTRQAGQAAWDGLGWLVAVPLAVTLRFDGDLPDGAPAAALTLAALCVLLQVSIGFALLLYRRRYRFGSFDEVFGVTITASIVTAATFGLVAFTQPPSLPRSTPLIAGSLALGFMLGGRFLVRAYRRRFASNRDGERTLVYGAGDSGAQLVEQMLRDPNSHYTPVGFLDDNPSTRHLHIHGQQVLGTGRDLEQAVAKTGATTLVVAIAGVDSKTLLRLDRRCQGLNIHLRVIPSTAEIVGGFVKLGDISHVTEVDLLGRRPIDTDEEGIREFLEGKRILITGAGGSIGSELARQVHRYNPAFVGILDRDESGIHAVQLSIDGQGLLSSDNLILADIRDAERMDEVMQCVLPDIVFHAAALKHLPLLQRYPEEARKTNVEGTRNVLDAAHRAGVAAFINISTDKAADPTSVLGTTKLKTEHLTAGMCPEMTPFGQSRYLSVRFGNVLGSRGSVLTAFRYQIQKGGPVTVTHPDVTRYFMTIPEAVHLVLQASVIGDHGETLILDMGEPVRIVDVAQQMIDKSGRDIDIVFTGLRPGEKLDEVLVSRHEDAVRLRHPLISHTRASSSRSPHSNDSVDTPLTP